MSKDVHFDKFWQSPYFSNHHVLITFSRLCFQTPLWNSCPSQFAGLEAAHHGAQRCRRRRLCLKVAIPGPKSERRRSPLFSILFNHVSLSIPFHSFAVELVAPFISQSLQLWPILHLENEDHVSRFSVDAELVPLCSPVVSAVFMFRPHKQEDGPQR